MTRNFFFHHARAPFFLYINFFPFQRNPFCSVGALEQRSPPHQRHTDFASSFFFCFHTFPISTFLSNVFGHFPTFACKFIYNERRILRFRVTSQGFGRVLFFFRFRDVRNPHPFSDFNFLYFCTPLFDA